MPTAGPTICGCPTSSRGSSAPLAAGAGPTSGRISPRRRATETRPSLARITAPQRVRGTRASQPAASRSPQSERLDVLCVVITPWFAASNRRAMAQEPATPCGVANPAPRCFVAAASALRARTNVGSMGLLSDHAEAAERDGRDAASHRVARQYEAGDRVNQMALGAGRPSTERCTQARTTACSLI